MYRQPGAMYAVAETDLDINRIVTFGASSAEDYITVKYGDDFEHDDMFFITLEAASADEQILIKPLYDGIHKVAIHIYSGKPLYPGALLSLTDVGRLTTYTDGLTSRLPVGIAVPPSPYITDSIFTDAWMVPFILSDK